MRDENWVGVTPAPPVQSLNPGRIRSEPSCAVEGHDYEHIVTGDGQLLRINCARCHRSWAVEEA